MSETARFVLKETSASERQGRPLWFKRMTGIGPMTTPDLEEAAVFDSREAAMRSPAFVHALSFYEPEEVDRA